MSDPFRTEKQLVFSTKSYAGWGERLQSLTGLELGALHREEFPDGEHYERVLSGLEDREVIVVSGTVDDAETLELFDLCNAIVDSGAIRLKIILPYFGYSTMERAVKSGEAVKAKYRARLLSCGIPQAPMGNRIYMLDLHSEGIPQYFERGTQTQHVYAKSIVLKAAKMLADKYAGESGGAAAFVLASADAGRIKWVESLAKDLGVAPAFAYKERIDGSSTVSLGVSGPVKGKFVVVYDDMIRTGSSLIHAAEAYMAAGATGVAAIATHAVFPGDALCKMKDSGLFKQIVVTDSHPRARLLESDFLKVESCVELFTPFVCDTSANGAASKEFEHAKA